MEVYCEKEIPLDYARREMMFDVARRMELGSRPVESRIYPTLTSIDKARQQIKQSKFMASYRRNHPMKESV